MAWVNPNDMLLDIDDPARSIDVKAIAKNVEAMANGDSGAPKIMPSALDSSVKVITAGTHGTNQIQKQLGRINLNGSANSYHYPELMLGVTGVTGMFTPLVDTVVTIAIYANQTIGAIGFDFEVLEMNRITPSSTDMRVVDSFQVLSFSGTTAVTYNTVTLAKGVTYLFRERNGGAIIAGFYLTVQLFTGNDVVCLA